MVAASIKLVAAVWATDMPRGKPKKCVNEFRVSGVDGFKDVSVGPASYANRMRGDFSKTGKSSKPGEALADVKARAERYGFDVDASEQVGLGLF